jgi:hypothetical protein
MKKWVVIAIFLVSCSAVRVVTLDGSTSNDPDGYVVRWQWRQLDGVPVGLSSYAGPVVTARIKGPATFELTVTDNRGATGKDTARVQPK